MSNAVENLKELITDFINADSSLLLNKKMPVIMINYPENTDIDIKMNSNRIINTIGPCFKYIVLSEGISFGVNGLEVEEGGEVRLFANGDPYSNETIELDLENTEDVKSIKEKYSLGIVERIMYPYTNTEDYMKYGDAFIKGIEEEK